MGAELTNEHFPFLARLSRESRVELGALATTRVPKKKQLLRRSDPANGAYLVVSGSLRVYYVTAEGREATLYHVEAGGTCVLALTSTLGDEPYPAWVDAGPSGSEFVRVPSLTFHRLFDGDEAFRKFVFGALSGRVFELMRALEETGTALVEQRVARYLLKQRDPDGSVRVTQQALASELGTAREVVFRVLRSLAQRKVVETARLRIRIVDIDGLTRVAGPLR
jgi:CRP/FNR family transcriptional regulator, anaerobic regulatory protein